MRERLVLFRVEWDVVRAFQLHTDRKIIATAAPAPARFAGMPRTLRAGDELNERTVAPHEEMRRYLEARYASVIRMRGRIELVQKKLLDAGTAEFARRKADRMKHEELDLHARGALIAIR